MPEDAEEPEEQEGSWVVTRHDLVGAKGLRDVEVLAEVADTALQPNRIISSVWSVRDAPPATASSGTLTMMASVDTPCDSLIGGTGAAADAASEASAAASERGDSIANRASV